MSKEKQLIRNTIIYAVGNLGSKLLTFLLLPIYTAYLLESEYGSFDLIVNTVSLILPIITFQVTDGIYRFILGEDDDNKVKKYISNGSIVIFINTIIFTVIYIISSIIFNFNNKILIFIYIISTIFYTLWSQILRGLKRNIEYAVAGIIVTIITLCLNILLIVKFRFGINGLMISYIIANLVATIYLEIKGQVLKFIDFKNINKKTVRMLCTYSIPLIPNVISWWVMNVSDRYMISYFLGAAFNGLYAIANKFSSIIIIINSFFSLAWQESAILEYDSKDRDEYYTKMFNSYMIIQFTGMLVLISLTKLGFILLIKGNYYQGYTIVPILYMASIFSAFSVFYGTGYLSANDTKGSFYTTIIGAVLNIIINLFTLPILGIEGAALSTLISYFVVWIVRVIQTKKYFYIKINKKDFSVLLFFNIVFCFLYYIDNFILSMIMTIVGTIIFVFYNKIIVRKLFKKVFRR